MRGISIRGPGLLTTVQDLGRKGFRQFGIPVCGAVDGNCLQAANILVGNPPGEAALELTMAGPDLEFGFSSVIGITGADMGPRINGRPVPMWQAVLIHPGDRLQFGWAQSGCRAYLAVAGGIDVPSVRGSKSTYIRGGFGGFRGRPLTKGDRLPVGVPSAGAEQVPGRLIPPVHIPEFKSPWTVRVVPGPQADCFTAAGLDTFFSQEYRVTKDADRMGCRLDGRAIGHLAGADIISDAVLPGSIQVPGNGCPIVMLADCNTTGGYAKIATVIQADLWKVGQARPGDIVRFAAVSVEEAQRIYRSHSIDNCPAGRPGSLNDCEEPAGGGVLGDLHGMEIFLTNGLPDDIFFITAPLTGIFFRSSRPGDRPYVQAGEVVEAGRTIGLLEFMKLTLEVKAGTGGQIAGILEDRQLVSSGQRIAAVRSGKQLSASGV